MLKVARPWRTVDGAATTFRRFYSIGETLDWACYVSSNEHGTIANCIRHDQEYGVFPLSRGCSSVTAQQLVDAYLQSIGWYLL